jgi:hypothetical protein
MKLRSIKNTISRIYITKVGYKLSEKMYESKFANKAFQLQKIGPQCSFKEM